MLWEGERGEVGQAGAGRGEDVLIQNMHTRKESLLVGNCILLMKSLSSLQETRRLEERIRFLEEE